jgi:O-antigen ligase
MSRSTGVLHWVLPAMLGLGALAVLLSGRDLSLLFNDLQAADMGASGIRGPIIVWGQRAVSILLVIAAAERVVSHIAQHKHLPSPILAWTFVTYWLSTVAAPAMFGSHRHLSHEYLYTLVIGFAVLLSTAADGKKILDASRNALFLFMLAGVVLIPVQPALVLDTSYAQGLLAGVPRLGGLATHPVALGMLAQVALLVLWARPFKRAWLTRLSWILGLFVLFMAQSKTAWGAFILCSACMLAVRHGANLWRRLGDPRQNVFGIVVCLCVIVGTLGVMALILLGNVEGQFLNFLDTSEGAQLISMTGRDQIWAVAIEEWQANPLFGYGPDLWDAAFRASIAMPNAVNAHNQFMDTLARSGSLGAAGLVLYASVLLVLSVRHAKTTGGLSLALFTGLALYSISEVPLMLFGYGPDLFAHLLLLVVLASAGSAVRVELMPSHTRPVYGTAS